ncbi:hypothetical protein [Streptomyces telluris]|uniref:Uncharacterized protein n=1 Tax=Streptomyces telluris TaxID=2720021 RepID=A0A9X2RNL8_9ACTN|nr:hypothetical protein [Streptomyces telluris]MCQ8770130.1 hypothetical protein [Streptomyces telluris]NJP76009.1 hypothetical protein [Streptomyces telluris]
MTARRPLLTAVAAGSLLCAVWFMPTANATVERTDRPAPEAHVAAPSAQGAEQQLSLAASGGVDTTPYVFGGVAFLAAGGALVTVAVRRTRTADR